MVGFEDQVIKKKKKLIVEEVYSSIDISKDQVYGVCLFVVMVKKFV